MNAKFTITLALAAGFLGGLASRYLGPAPVYAQAPASPPEIRAQKFVLVDEAGVARGVFGIETNGAPEIEITGSRGRVYACAFRSWSLIHGFLTESASPGPKKPTLLPVK
ncbi:exported hypothetical protein [Candidatus Sulfopaludibacter sp. SbA4]|nr:exported hypothetical protein [Candidatus Sulfopaludibacter sp. SbA4]